MSGDVVLLVHAAATWAMVGLIWFVQVVHYPLFAAVGEDRFVAYEAHHTRRTTWVVAAFMPLELGTALWIAATRSDLGPLAWIGAGLATVVWAVTIAIQVPQHRRLSRGFDRPTWDALVSGNRIRALVWSARGVVALALLAAA